MPQAKIQALPGQTVKEKILLGTRAEKIGDTARAIALYEQAIQIKPLEETAHKRLMVIYRKNKNARQEIKVINRALKIWREHFKSLQNGLHAKNPQRAKIKKLSMLIEKKIGAHHQEPEPISTWLKRKKQLENKKPLNEK